MNRTTERHPLDVFSLLAGIVLIGIGVVFVVGESASLEADVAWVFAALLVGLGLAGALGTITRRRPPDGATAGVETGDDDEDTP